MPLFTYSCLERLQVIGIDYFGEVTLRPLFNNTCLGTLNGDLREILRVILILVTNSFLRKSEEQFQQ